MTDLSHPIRHPRAGWRKSIRAAFSSAHPARHFTSHRHWGHVRAQGPLALKRELSEVQHKLDATDAEFAHAEQEAANLERELRELTSALDGKTQQCRDAERESANSGAALRQMEQETARIERRLQEWALAADHNREARHRSRKPLLVISRRQQRLRPSAQL